MPTFRYVAKDKSGKSVTGFMDAATQTELVSTLRKRELVIVSISETKTKAKTAVFSFGGSRVKLDDLVIFSRQLATMVDAGIPVVNALDILGEQIEKQKFREIILRVRDAVETGSSLSEGMSRYPAVFSELFVSMVRAGESSGALDEILDRVATYLEKTNALIRKVRAAMVYPAIVTIMAISITIIMLVKVVPVFQNIYQGFGAALPRPTAILISVSNFLRDYLAVVAGAIFFLFFLLNRYSKTERGKLVVDRSLLKMPIFGVLLRKVAVSKFSRTLSTLVRSGVPILNSLEIVGKTSGNKAIENAVLEVRSSIREGENIATPLARSRVFPPMVVRMVAVGEQTGELEKMLNKISDFYDEQVDASVTGLTSMIEPLIIAFLGVVVGTVVICMFLPIFRLSTIIKM